MSKNFEINEPNEDLASYPPKALEEKIEEKIEGKPAHKQGKTKEMLLVAGVSLAVVAGSIFATYKRFSLYTQNPRIHSHGWEVVGRMDGKKVVHFWNDGDMIIYSNPFSTRDNMLVLFDRNLDGKVDSVESEIGVYSRHILENAKLFEMADKKYKKYKEQLAELIQEAEKAWKEQYGDKETERKIPEKLFSLLE